MRSAGEACSERLLSGTFNRKSLSWPNMANSDRHSLEPNNSTPPRTELTPSALQEVVRCHPSDRYLGESLTSNLDSLVPLRPRPSPGAREEPVRSVSWRWPVRLFRKHLSAAYWESLVLALHRQTCASPLVVSSAHPRTYSLQPQLPPTTGAGVERYPMYS
jgi:hypothetical protein